MRWEGEGGAFSLIIGRPGLCVVPPTVARKWVQKAVLVGTGLFVQLTPIRKPQHFPQRCRNPEMRAAPLKSNGGLEGWARGNDIIANSNNDILPMGREQQWPEPLESLLWDLDLLV